MKLLFLVALLVVAAQAHPSPQFYYAGGFGDFFRDLGASFLDVLRNRLQTAGDFENEYDTIPDAVAAALDDVFQDSIPDLIDSVTQKINDYEYILEGATDSLQNQQFQQIISRLNDTLAPLSTLESTRAALNQVWGVDIENDANEIVEKWEEWAVIVAANSSNASNKAKKQIQSLLDDHVDTFTGFLNGCADDVKNSIASYDAKVENSIKNDYTILGNLSKQVQICLQTSAASCQSALHRQLRSFSAVPYELNKLIAEGNSLNVAFNETDCAKSIIENAADEKVELLQEINKLQQQ